MRKLLLAVLLILSASIIIVGCSNTQQGGSWDMEERWAVVGDDSYYYRTINLYQPDNASEAGKIIVDGSSITASTGSSHELKPPVSGLNYLMILGGLMVLMGMVILAVTKMKGWKIAAAVIASGAGLIAFAHILQEFSTVIIIIVSLAMLASGTYFYRKIGY